MFIVVSLQGGLGNQMFQFATAKHLAVRNSCQLYLDLSFFDENSIPNEGFTPRQYELDIFLRNQHIADKSIINSFYSGSKIISLLKKWFKIPNKFIFHEKSLLFDHNVLDITSTVLLNGFFQSEKYFSSIRETFLNIFKFPSLNEPILDIIKSKMLNCNSVGIHVRRGDFVSSAKTNKFHGICDVHYYQRAVSMFDTKLNNPLYFFFSDDIEWVSQHLIFNGRCSIVDTRYLPHWVDMYLMSICKHNIIANSSYSWWAAWLNQNEAKLVIAPSKWFEDVSMNLQTSDLYPNEWIKI